jgi:hypothetical protein
VSAETDLLPLPMPKGDVADGGIDWTDDEMQAYARANVAHATAPLQAEIEALRAEVDRLQEIVRPKREDECLTLDHWRMRAYYLEENWSRCSHACAGEQTKREQAEARAERLAEVLNLMVTTHDEGGWPTAAIVIARAALEQEIKS